jgi:hypothetical protein
MLKHATTITVIGFILLFVGIMTFFLTYVGVDFILLKWLYQWSPGISYLVRLLMMVLGLVLIYVGRTDWAREEI